MAGHSKWSNIQHRKGRQDAKRAKVFTKIIREISVAARNGPDPFHNPALRLALDKAYGNNMSKDTVERAIKRGSGDTDGGNYFSATYEGYASGGVAILVDCLTDNINRTVSEVRHCFTKYGGNLGTNGSVSYLFNPVGYFAVKSKNEDDLLSAIIDFDLISMNEAQNDDDDDYLLFEINSNLQDFVSIKNKLEKDGFEIIYSELTKIPENSIQCDDILSEKVMKVVDALEDLDDVQAVFHNANLKIDG